MSRRPAAPPPAPLLVVVLVHVLFGAGCPAPRPTGPGPITSDSADLEAVLSTAFRADIGQPRALEVRLAWIGAGRPESAAVELVIAEEIAELGDGGSDGDGRAARVVRSFPVALVLLGEQPAALTVTWDGRDDGGAEVQAGRYQVRLTARAGALTARAERPIAVGLVPTLPLGIDAPDRPPPPLPAGRPAPGGLPYAVFLGNLHAQSNHSDGGGDPGSCAHAEKPRAGVGDPAAAYEYARATARLDFLLLSEHNHMYDGDANSVAPGATPDAARALFDDGRRLAAEARVAHPGFLALYGTEYGVVAGGGHVNLLNPSGLVTWERAAGGDLLGHFLVEKSDYKGLYALMRREGMVGQFNHPDTDQFAVAGEAMAFDEGGDQVMCLAEVANAPAFSNRTDEGDPDINLFEGGFHRLLLRGYHVAPSSNQDNHCANWGRSARNRTGVLVPTGVPLSEASLLDSLRARRVFATTDRTAMAVLVVDGRLMGERFEQGGAPPVIRIHYASDGAEPLASIDLMVGRKGGARVSPRRLDGLSATTSALGAGDWFLYARLRQADGDTLWTAPVWLSVR